MGDTGLRAGENARGKPRRDASRAVAVHTTNGPGPQCAETVARRRRPGRPGAPADARKGRARRCDPPGGNEPGRTTRSRPAPSSPARPTAHRAARTTPRATSRVRNAAPRKRSGRASPRRPIIPVAVHGRGAGITRLPACEIRTRTDRPLPRRLSECSTTAAGWGSSKCCRPAGWRARASWVSGWRRGRAAGRSRRRGAVPRG
jgi:hypothetical protein